MSSADQFAISRTTIGRTTVFQPHGQASAQLTPMQDVFKVVASQSSTPQWGSFSDVNLSPNDFSVLNNVLVRIDVGAITGVTGGPASFVADGTFTIQRVEVSIQEKLIDVLYPESMYARDLTEYPNELKSRFMAMSGNATLATRKTRGASAQSFWIEIPSFWSIDPGFFVRALNTPIKIRVVLANLGDCVHLNGGTGTPACVVNSVSLLASGREFSNPAAAVALQQSYKRVPNILFRYLTPVQMSKQSLVAGSATYGVNLTSVQGWVSHLFVIVRTAASVSTTNGNSPDQFVPVYSLNVKTTGGALISGGSELLSDYALNYQSTLYWRGDLTDVASGLGSSPKALYSIVFSQDPHAVTTKGSQLGGYHFSGSEILNLTFPAALSANHVVDIIAATYATLSLDAAGNAAKI